MSTIVVPAVDFIGIAAAVQYLVRGINIIKIKCDLVSGVFSVPYQKMETRVF